MQERDTPALLTREAPRADTLRHEPRVTGARGKGWLERLGRSVGAHHALRSSATASPTTNTKRGPGALRPGGQPRVSRSSCAKNPSSWSALLFLCCLHGRSKEGIGPFRGITACA